MALYTSEGKDFKHQVHPTLQRRISLYLVIGGIAFLVVARDIYGGFLSPLIALVVVIIGAFAGFLTSRIYHLSWNEDGAHVIGRIDTIGWVVLALYIIFELARTTLFKTILPTGFDPTAITFAFIASALTSRVLGLRGRILQILNEEKVLGS